MSKLQQYIAGLLTPLAISCVRDLSTSDQFFTPDTYTDSFDSSLQRRTDSMLDLEADTLSSPQEDIPRLEDIITDTRTIPEDTPIIYDIPQDQTVTLDSVISPLDIVPDSISLPETISDAAVPEIIPDTPLIDTAPELKIDIPSEITLPEITQETTIPDISKDLPPQNTPPQLLPVGNKSTAEGQLLSFFISATDTENDPVTYLNLTETSLPNFSLNPKSGEVLFQPNYSFIKHPLKEQNISLKFSAYDGKDYSKPITLNALVIDTNHIPNFTSTMPLNALIDQEYTYIITAADKDPEDMLQYTLITAPKGATLDKNKIVWKPNKDQVGSQTLEIAVTDGIDEIKQKGVIEVKQLYFPYTKDEHCVALWHFDWPNEFGDSCNGLKLSNKGTTETVSMKGFGSARVFKGDSYFELPYTPSLDIKNAITIEALVKPQVAKNSFKGDFGNLITRAEGGADSYSGFVLYFGNGYLAAVIALNNGEFKDITAPFDLPTDTFTHVAFTYDGSKMKLYGNKVLLTEKAASGKLYYKSPKNLFIGWNYCCTNGFIGAIDEVRISSIAREF